jgi:hypothetical protein
MNPIIFKSGTHCKTRGGLRAEVIKVIAVKSDFMVIYRDCKTKVVTQVNNEGFFIDADHPHIRDLIP